MLSLRFLAFFFTLWSLVAGLPAPTTSDDEWEVVPPKISRSSVNGDNSYYYGGTQAAATAPHTNDLANYAKLAYGQMIKVGRKSEALPATMSALYVPSKNMIYFRSSIKGSAPGATSKAITIYDPDFPHATNGNCAEMNAISAVTSKDKKIPGAQIATYGLRSDGSGPEPLAPCVGNSGDGTCGCAAYLPYYDVDPID